jgi:integrase
MSALVTVVIRTKVDGKRNWEVGKRRLTPGEFYYIRWKENGKHRYRKAGVALFQAEDAALTQGKILKGELEPPRSIKQHRITDSLTAYLLFLRNPRTLKNDNRTYRPKSIREREADIKEFRDFHKQHYVEQIQRNDLIGWKNSLTLQPNTIRGKLSAINHWLQWAGMPKMLKETDWPRKSSSRPKPYTLAEIDAQLAVAHGRDHMMLRVALYGFRKMELATLERYDVSDTAPIITVQEAKTNLDWVPKTTAGARQITIDKGLWEDLKQLPNGLIFPAHNGEVDIHIDRLFEAIGVAAKVRKPAGHNVGWVHRWRHTCATELVRNKDLAPLEILKQMGWTDFKMLEIYAHCDPEAPHVMAAAERRARPKESVNR